MQIYDISLTVSPSMPVWPGDPKIKLERVSKIEQGSEANVTRLEMSAHTGTHVDAPFHFLGGDTQTVDELPLEQLIGRVHVQHLPDEVGNVTAQVLNEAGIPPNTRRLLIKTRNSKIWEQEENQFQEDFVAISPDGAEYLVERGIKVVGVDYLSVAPYQDGAPTHTILLEAGVILIEGLDLSLVPEGRYTMYCLPLKLKGCDGAPARVILTAP